MIKQIQMQNAIFVLGSPNSPNGKLSPISESRIERAITIQNGWSNSIILATGGFGLHFNASELPHRELVHRALSARGALYDDADVGDLLSSNTVEDATMIAAFAKSRHLTHYAVVTSGFHLPRCRYIFACLETQHIDFFAADDPADLDPEIVRHEASALALLVAQGGIVVDDLLHPCQLRSVLVPPPDSVGIASLRQYACAILLRDGNILLGKRAYHRKAYPGRWDVIGGKVEDGETVDEALHRELGEEIGIVPTSYDLLCSLADNGGQARGEAVYHIHLVDKWIGGEPSLVNDEHTSLSWFQIDDACALQDLALAEYVALFRSIDMAQHSG